MQLSQIIKRVSEELDIPNEVVELTYKSYWYFIRSKILELPLMDDLTEDLFNLLRTSFNIPSLGKLYCTFNNILNLKKRYKQRCLL